MEAQRLAVKLPVVRRVKFTSKLEVEGRDLNFEEGQTVLLDIVSCPRSFGLFHSLHDLLTHLSQFEASKDKDKFGKKAKDIQLDYESSDYLPYVSSLSAGLGPINGRSLVAPSLAAMIKVMAQMRNLRRAHHTQGRLKRINIDQGYESYASYMAPMRVEELRRKKKEKPAPRPDLDTYVTPEWDEMIPFPSTWKVRFDGYGATEPKFFDDFAIHQKEPDQLRYQPNGPSHVGGTFAEQICICNVAGIECQCKEGKAEAKGEAGKTEVLKSIMGSQHAGCGW